MQKNKRIIIIALSVILLLLIPLFAMQFTNEVQWKLGDFAAAGILLSAAGFSCEIVLRKVQKKPHRIALCAVILLTLFLLWAELAVGIFGTPFGGT